MKKLLIVDDSLVMRRIIEKFTGKMELELVGTAGDGVAALEIFRETLPDIVTMDITMPEMDGITCMKEMLKLRPETQIIVITALNNPDTNFQVMELGAADFISKPFKAEELEEALLNLDD